MGSSARGPEAGSARRPVSSDGRGRAHGYADFQRARIIAATLALCREKGSQSVTVADITARAGVSRRTFYETYGDRHDCYLAVFEHSSATIAAAVAPACAAPARWTERLRGGVEALLDALASEPAAAHFCFVEALAAGPATLARRQELLAELSRLVERGRDQRSAQPPPPLAAEAAVGAAFSIIHSRLLEDGARRLGELLEPLMSALLVPYLGPDRTREEIARGKRQRAAPPARRALEPLAAGTPIRLTYRTVRVLAAIAQHPGATSREVAQIAEVPDQGQMSRLVARLAKLELIDNTAGDLKHAPKSWVLTGTGRGLNEELTARFRPHW
jgi:AcrR family transcriptional regulator